ncbi:MAG TPA: SCO family protein [Polyangiaceae bacterium]|nr:SCO family protein [Polyangiaceae bacterium]
MTPDASTPAPRSDPRRLIGVAVLVAALVAAAVVGLVVRSAGSEPAADAARFAYAARAGGAPPKLWHVPEFKLVDQGGAAVTPSSLAGQPWIADFIFTTCTSVCPMLSAKMRLLERALPAPDLRFVSFSVDPEHDTVDALRAYGERWSPGDRRWLLLRTEADSLATVSKGMRVTVTATGDAENAIIHTSMFFLVDAAGEVRGVYDSNDAGALARLVDDAHELSPNGAGPSAAQGAGRSGEQLFREIGCGACHDDAEVAPSLRGIWGKAVAFEDGASATVDAAYVRESLTAPALHLVRGYPNLMPSYANALSDSDVDALVEYVHGLSTQVAPALASGMPSAAVMSPHAASAGSAAEAEPGVVVDPVCGMQVRATSDAPHADYAGHTFYFCSASCRDAFAKNPAHYGK